MGRKTVVKCSRCFMLYNTRMVEHCPICYKTDDPHSFAHTEWKDVKSPHLDFLFAQWETVEYDWLDHHATAQTTLGKTIADLRENYA